MALIDIILENINEEHICCAISDKKGENCVGSKKDWLKERFADGLVFKKLDARGKVFIEYIPAEKAWCPVNAKNYMFINCFWVSGQFKGQGYANQLLDACIVDAKEKGKSGLVVLSSQKKMPFLSDPKYLKYKSFQVADTAYPYYELLYLPFTTEKSSKNVANGTANEIVPSFKECAKKGEIAEQGMVLYYANQCPHTDKYAPLVKEWAEKEGTTVKLIHIKTTEQAQNAPSPFTSYSFFYNGKFLTNEIFGEKKFFKFLMGIDF